MKFLGGVRLRFSGKKGAALWRLRQRVFRHFKKGSLDPFLKGEALFVEDKKENIEKLICLVLPHTPKTTNLDHTKQNNHNFKFIFIFYIYF
jgi:hypothetical protein|uniref:ORF90 n=1 Tax=Tetradesmus obliquus TaxID=3088 RepID=Q9MD34_TETOB|nr:ORF90 [Tetradesmus obliquus]CAB90361.1 ORF90 [Tetradesmus obliquus]